MTSMKQKKDTVILKGIEVVDAYYKKHPNGSSHKTIEEIRDFEDSQILLHMKAIFKILKTKCARCKASSCLGCTLSPGDGLKGEMVKALDYMKTQNYGKFYEVFANAPMESLDEAEKLFESIADNIWKK